MVKEAHRVVDGRVFCARSGRDVDVERCLRCRRLRDLELDTRNPYIECDSPLAAFELAPEARKG